MVICYGAMLIQAAIQERMPGFQSSEPLLLLPLPLLDSVNKTHSFKLPVSSTYTATSTATVGL